VALVLSLWDRLQNIPHFPFLIFVAVTSAFFGVGLYAQHRWKLESTSRGLLVIATLLVPLNFLAIAGLSKGQWDNVTLEGEPVEIAFNADYLIDVLSALENDNDTIVVDCSAGIGPDVEAVASRRPDLVVLYASAANRAAADRLTALGIATTALQLDRSDDVRRAARTIGALAGVRGAADSFVAAFDSALWAVIASAARPGRRLRLYVDAWASPPMTVGRGSYLSEVIRAAGA
jgi:hypothetical protein